MTDRYPLGGTVPLGFEVLDAAGDLADAATVTLTITLPDGTTATPTVTHDSTGIYSIDYVPAAAGRYTARFVATGDNAGAVEDVFDVTASNLAYVTVTDVSDYLGDTSASNAEMADALAAEQAAQAARCRIDPYTYDLRQALLRRVARNLAARGVVLAQFNSFEGGGTQSVRVPMLDAEIVRFEAPHRKRKVG